MKEVGIMSSENKTCSVELKKINDATTIGGGCNEKNEEKTVDSCSSVQVKVAAAAEGKEKSSACCQGS